MGSETEVQLFISACERLLAAADLQRPLSEDEMSLVEYYCKEILTKIASSLRPDATEPPEMSSPGPVLLTSLLPVLKEKQSVNV